jgi:dipeptidyl aminopeptidase/acylaminoacyl peptidase
MVFSPAFSSPGFALANLSTLWADYHLFSDLAYGDKARQKLDLYYPADFILQSATTEGILAGLADYPVVMFLYGGGWQSGQKEQYRFVADCLTQAGFAVIIPDYRLYPQVRFPTFVEDVAQATHWLGDHWRQGPSAAPRFHVMGHSAGAHIGALMTVNPSYLAPYGLEKAIASFTGLAGPYHFTPEEPVYKAIFGPPEHYPAMQVGQFIDGSEPPLFLLHGLKDERVGLFNLERVLDAALAHEGTIKVKTYESLDHKTLLGAFSPIIPFGEDVVDDVLAFLNEHAGKK